jgi:hypothetical protein
VLTKKTANMSSTKLKPAQVAKRLNMSRPAITYAIRNGRLKLDNNRLIDLNDPLNLEFVEQRMREDRIKIEKPKPVPKPKIEIPEIEDDDDEPEKETKQESDAEKTAKQMSADLYEEKLKLEIERLKNQNKIELLKIAKLEGELIPVSAVETVFLWAADNFKKTFENDVDGMINVFLMILGGDQSKFIEMKKQALAKISETGDTLKQNLIEGLENAIETYKEVRGRGERK